MHADCIIAPTYFTLCLPIIFLGYFYEIWVGYDVGHHVVAHLYIHKTKKEHFNKKKIFGDEYTVFLIITFFNIGVEKRNLKNVS